MFHVKQATASNGISSFWRSGRAASISLRQEQSEVPGTGISSRWVDIGSGAGFPGLVVAILAKELDPDLAVTLVESDARKAAFLRAVMRETSVEARLEVARAERIAPQGADVLSARALAPLDRLLALAERHLGQKGVALFPKGANAETEIEAALARWSFRCEKHPSRTDAKAVILKIGEPIRG